LQIVSEKPCYYHRTANNIVSVSFIGGGNRSTQRKPPTCHMSQTNIT